MDSPNQKAACLRDLYFLLASSIVNHASQLVVRTETAGGKTLVIVDGNAIDYGRLLGQSARMFKSCESILRNSIFAKGLKVDLLIDVPRQQKHFSKFTPMVNWSEDDDRRMAELLNNVAITIFKQPQITHRPLSYSASAFTLEMGEDFQSHPMSIRVSEALEIWFDAVGRTRGRIVYLDFL